MKTLSVFKIICFILGTLGIKSTLGFVNITGLFFTKRTNHGIQFYPSDLSNHGPRIINGNNAKANEFPYMAMLLKRTSQGYSFFCGGALLDETHLITAAHCAVFAARPSDVIVRLGEHDVRVHSGDEVDVKVSKIIIHDGYNEDDSVVNDIAIFKLKNKVILSSKIRSIHLVESRNETWDNTKATLTGWGMVNLNGKQLAPVLQKVKLRVISHEDCKSLWGDEGYAIYKSQVCVYEHTKSACMGDSGGPLIIENESGGREEIGIVSWGTSTCMGMPGVFTRVSSYLDWITANTAN